MQASTVGLQIIVTTPAAECLKVQTWPSVGVAPCREQSGRAVLDAQLDVSYFGAHSRPEKPPHRFPAMHAALHRVPRYFTDCSAVPRAPPYSAGVSVESAPRVYEHLQSALVLQCTRDTMRPSRACQGLFERPLRWIACVGELRKLRDPNGAASSRR